MDQMTNLPLQSLLQTATECHTLLAAVDVPHVIIGGLAVCLHGYDRGSRDVDLLVRRGDWERIRSALESSAYVWSAFRRAYYSPSKVRVDFRFSGEHSRKGDVHLCSVSGKVRGPNCARTRPDLGGPVRATVRGDAR